MHVRENPIIRNNVDMRDMMSFFYVTQIAKSTFACLDDYAMLIQQHNNSKLLCERQRCGDARCVRSNCTIDPGKQKNIINTKSNISMYVCKCMYVCVRRVYTRRMVGRKSRMM